MISRSALSDKSPVVPLGKAATFLDHLRKPVKESERVRGDYPYYGANGKQGTIDGYIFDQPAILLAEDGGNFGHPTRKIAYRVSGKYWVNNHAHILIPNEGVDIGFLCRVVENYDVTPFVSGSTRAKLTKGQAQSIPIPLPPLPEQRRIAAILDKADALRQKRQAAIARLDDLLQSVFLDMFGDPVTNPKGWEVGSIGDLLQSVKYGTSQKANTDHGIPILRMNNITYSGRIDLTVLKYLHLAENDFEKYTVKEGDILFNRTNSKELVGKSAVYIGPTPMAYAGYLVRGRVTIAATPEYIIAYLNSPWGKKKLQSMCKSIVGMANINAKEFAAIPIAHPPINIQKAFSNFVKETTEQLRRFNDNLHDMDDLFLSLQQRAFAGTL